MNQKQKQPRKAVSPKFRTNPVKDEKLEETEEEQEQEQPESLAEEQLAPDDSFVLFSSQVVDFVVKNKVPVIAVIGGMLIAGLGGSLYSGYAASQEVELASESYGALRVLPEFSGQAAEGSDKAQQAEAYSTAADKLTGIAQANPKSVGGQYAQLYAANSYMKAGDSAASLKAFQTGAQNASNDTFKNFALSGVVAAQSAGGDEGAVVEAQRQRVAQLSGVWKESALLDLGRTLEGVGKGDEAATTYEQLVKDFPYSPFVDDAKERLGTLKPGSTALTEPAIEANASE